MLTTPQLITRIHALNPSADLRWLAQFSRESLQQYLDHLETTQEPRGTRWQRPDGSPVLVTRTPAA
jgi:hypothetical protein